MKNPKSVSMTVLGNVELNAYGRLYVDGKDVLEAIYKQINPEFNDGDDKYKAEEFNSFGYLTISFEKSDANEMRVSVDEEESF